jgi:flavin reductase (DIM6/NTAB) family NADH-FMN oxidoreductase RutF
MIEQQQFRDVMSGVCTPVTIVTSAIGGVPFGTTVSSFASLSLDPPLVSLALDRRSSLLAPIQTAGRFAVNILGRTQDDLAVVFARRDVDRFSATDWYFERGLPRLTDAPSWMECDLHRTVEAGDHLLLLGLLRSARSRGIVAPLVYANRTFGTHSRFCERSRPDIVDLIAACAR